MDVLETANRQYVNTTYLNAFWKFNKAGLLVIGCRKTKQ